MEDSRFKILVVDDEDDVRRNIEKTLVHANFNVVTTADGKEALQALRVEDFSLIILDLIMPTEKAGIDLLKKIVEKYPETPVIMLTAKERANQAREVKQHGVEEYLVKGNLDGQEFLDKVIHHLKDDNKS